METRIWNVLGVAVYTFLLRCKNNLPGNSVFCIKYKWLLELVKSCFIELVSDFCDVCVNFLAWKMVEVRM